MLTEIPSSPHIITETETSPPPYAVTPYTLTLILAYLHYYTPKRLSGGRFLAPTHLRKLAEWIGDPAPEIRSIRQHTRLAAHFALLHVNGLWTTVGTCLTPKPVITPWMHQSRLAQIHTLLRPLQNARSWDQTVAALGLENTVTEDYTAYLKQSLIRQLDHLPDTPDPAVWLSSESEKEWVLHLPHSLPLWLHFDLRQLGQWLPGKPLVCTPMTIATAAKHGYSSHIMQWLLETATQQPVPLEKQAQLDRWARRAITYRLGTVQLLSAAQPHQLQALIDQKSIRNAVIEQLSPRHAIVNSSITPTLDNWLIKQGFALQHNPAVLENGPDPAHAYQWLSTRVLSGLAELLPLPVMPLHTLLAHLDQQIDPLQKTEMEALAITILDNVREAIRGRDAYFPPTEAISSQLLEIVQQALADESDLTITYQALGDCQPSRRRIQPLRLEEKGSLYYMYAYCYRAEKNLTFRLDRIHLINRGEK